MKKTLGLEIEVEFLSLYEEQPLFGDVQNLLSKSGFEFIDFINLCRWERNAYNGYGQCVFGDALFLRTPENLIQMAHSDINVISKYLAICLLYNRFDLIDRTLDLIDNCYLNALSDFINAMKPIKRKHLRVQRINYINSILLRLLGQEYGSHLIY